MSEQRIAYCDKVNDLALKIPIINTQIQDIAMKLELLKGDIAVFQRWLIGVILLSFILSFFGSFWKVTEEFKELRNELKKVELRITEGVNK